MTPGMPRLRCSAALRRFLLEAARGAEGTVVRVEGRRRPWGGGLETTLTFAFGDGRKLRRQIARPPHEVTDDDMAPIRRSLARSTRVSHWLGRAWHLAAWWIGFTTLFAGSTTCPCCGQAGCPLGAGAAGTFGAVAALAVTKLRSAVVGGQ